MWRIILLFLLFTSTNCAPTDPVTPPSNTIIRTKTNAEDQGRIEYKVLEKPHHLFIGRCSPTDEVLHQENIILHNDGKSQVAADIRVNVEADVYITCANIFDEIPNGEGGYPSFVAGGVGYNFVQFNVATDYGKGFHFFVQIFGHEIKNKEDNKIH